MINVTLGEVKPQENPFPRVMKNNTNGCLVLFYAEKEGIWITGGHLIGYHATQLDISCFTDYNDPITIQNA
jgi:hypothetical protein